MPRPLCATIHLSALHHNLGVVRRHAPGVKVWAVVKANAYGHGIERALRGFAEADGLALIEPDAALKLRALGWQKPVLLLEGFFDPSDLPPLSAARIEVAVHCFEQIAMLEAAQLATPMNVHLKMNTGMNRLGVMPADYATAHARLAACPNVAKISLMTHFANGEAQSAHVLPVAEQVRRFQQGAAGLSGERSLSNSAAVLLHPLLGCDWVRPGIMLYGATPGGKSAQEFGLQAAMTLSSEIIGVQELTAGEAVGYGCRFIAPVPMRVGVVACGYADGYPRHAQDGAPVLVAGVRTRLLGRVSMDMLAVDLTPVPGARVGSQVILWGKDLPIDEVAQAAGTIGYELMCAVAPRVRILED
ncbi:alanine racemase [Massilia sp. W12]|uniref:alanine racemase n=1 Tax=Massilia sp. W12 TaxID=3126507 RepID=UPI0030CD4AD1